MYRVFVHEFYTAWRWYSIASGSLFSEDNREYFSWDLVLGLIFYVNNSSDSLRGGGGGVGEFSPIKVTGVLIGMFREHP